MKRNNTIDTLRTIATLLVIMLHISSAYVISSMNNLTYDVSFWIGNIVDSFSRICVPLFVLISGMFLVGRTESFRQSYQKRTSRILIPLVFWTIVYLLFRAILASVLGHSIDIKSLVESVILGKPYYHMWYLFMLIGLYLFTPVLNFCIPNISRKALWKVAIALLIFGMFNHVYDLLYGNRTIFLLWFINYLGYFMLGYLIRDYERCFSFLFLLTLYLISSAAIAALSFYSVKIYHSLYFYDYLTPFVIVASLSIYKLFHQLNLAENFLSKISHLTLGIYLIHPGVLQILDLGLRKWDLDTLDNAIIGIPIKFIVVLFISLLAAKLISQVKYLNRTI